MRKVLTIAGSDSSAGAGIQADLKTFAAHGVYGLSVITAITAQNTKGVKASQDVPVEMIDHQLKAIFDDIEVDAVKIGMVSNADAIDIIAKHLGKYCPQKVVLDPVMVSTSGFPLLQPEAREALVKKLFPLTFLVTPNLAEAEVLTGIKISTLDEMREGAKEIAKLGPQNVLLKGGHLEGQPIDVLYDRQEAFYFYGERLEGIHTHGTGCTLSSSIASNLAKNMDIREAIERSKEYITTAIRHSIQLGEGAQPTHHFYHLYQKAGWNDKE